MTFLQVLGIIMTQFYDESFMKLQSPIDEYECIVYLHVTLSPLCLILYIFEVIVCASLEFDDLLKSYKLSRG